MAAITSIVAVAGLALGAFGAYQSYQGAQGQNAAQQQMIAGQQRAEGERRKMMELEHRRRTLESIRMGQRARALALTNATSQNAQLGSGLQGGYGQIAGQTGTNLLALNQAVESGRSIFDINAQISQANLAYAQAGTSVNLGQGLSSLGGSMITSLPAVSALSQTYFPNLGPAPSNMPSFGPYPRIGG